MFAVEITESAESDLDQINNDCYLGGLGDEPNVDDAFAFGISTATAILISLYPLLVTHLSLLISHLSSDRNLQ